MPVASAYPGLGVHYTIPIFHSQSFQQASHVESVFFPTEWAVPSLAPIFEPVVRRHPGYSVGFADAFIQQRFPTTLWILDILYQPRPIVSTKCETSRVKPHSPMEVGRSNKVVTTLWASHRPFRFHYYLPPTISVLLRKHTTLQCRMCRKYRVRYGLE